jgi:hypothetical protein
MFALLAAFVMASALGADATHPPAPAADAADLSIRSEPHGREFRCAGCHTTDGWRNVTFAHDRTGFPLTGRHRDAHCPACHPGGDFALALPRACSACHRDVHSGRMGAHCDRCHEPSSWKDESFGPESHRRTSFPLAGRHAVIPCEECHPDRRDRSFSRPAPRCIGCHELDFGPRASAAGVDHLASGFAEDCRGCHGTWRFSPATIPAHDACFQITLGPHAGIRCRDCHDAGPPPVPAGGALTCATDTADCLRCHRMPGIQAGHTGVGGFQPANRRCYECHRFSK